MAAINEGLSRANFEVQQLAPGTGFAILAAARTSNIQAQPKGERKGAADKLADLGFHPYVSCGIPPVMSRSLSSEMRQANKPKQAVSSKPVTIKRPIESRPTYVLRNSSAR